MSGPEGGHTPASRAAACILVLACLSTHLCGALSHPQPSHLKPELDESHLNRAGGQGVQTQRVMPTAGLDPRSQTLFPCSLPSHFQHFIIHKGYSHPLFYLFLCVCHLESSYWRPVPWECPWGDADRGSTGVCGQVKGRRGSRRRPLF